MTSIEPEVPLILKVMNRKTLNELVRKYSEENLDKKLTYMENELIQITKCPTGEHFTLRRNLKYFKSEFKKKWSAASNKEKRFLKNNENWLNTSIKLVTWTTPKPGRLVKDFGESSDRSKRCKTKGIRETISADELTFAASMSQHAAGNIDVSKMIKKITLTNRKRKRNLKKHTPSEALSIFVEANLSKKQYEVIRAANKNIYPCYSLIKNAKQDCYPKKESMNITETCAEVNLQDLLDHTSLQLNLYRYGAVMDLNSHSSNSYLRATDINPVPSSIRFCRPIRIRFLHETADITKEEIQFIEKQVSSLNKSDIPTASGVLLHIKHILLPTMVDAKVCNAATSTSSTIRYYICGNTSKNFNNLNIEKEINNDALKFGLSILHARIRLFEHIIHLVYKLPIKKWQASLSSIRPKPQKKPLDDVLPTKDISEEYNQKDDEMDDENSFLYEYSTFTKIMLLYSKNTNWELNQFPFQDQASPHFLRTTAIPINAVPTPPSQQISHRAMHPIIYPNLSAKFPTSYIH
ncbi:hypothetical protein QTP88_013516 [Uroleucon formosanum]